MGSFGFGFGVTRRRASGGGTPAPAPTEVTFGALTFAAAGGVPVTGTSISSGDPNGHFTVSGGLLTVSAAGDAANLSGGPYSLVFNDGSMRTVNIAPNEWDVRTTAEWDTVIAQSAATLSGKKIAIRPGQTITTGVNGTAARLRRNDYGGLEIYCRDTASMADFAGEFYLRGCRNVTFRRLRSQAVAGRKFYLLGEAANHLENITIDQCHIRGATADPNGDYSTSTNYPNFGIDLITTQGSANGSVGNVTITNNTVEWGATLVGIVVSKAGASVVVSGNLLRFFYDDAVGFGRFSAQSVNCPAVCNDNVIYGAVGKSTDSANPHTDGIRFIASSNQLSDWTISVNRNIVFVGDARGDGHLQGMLASDFKQSGVDSGYFFTGEAIGNLIVTDMSNAFSVENAKNFVMVNNTVVGNKTSGGAFTAGLRVGSGSTDSTTSGIHRIQRNLAETYTIGGTPTLTDNLTLGKGGATIPFADVFVGPSWYPTTRAEALAWFSRKAGGPADLGGTYDAGAVGSGAVVFPSASPGSGGANNVS